MTHAVIDRTYREDKPCKVGAEPLDLSFGFFLEEKKDSVKSQARVSITSGAEFLITPLHSIDLKTAEWYACNLHVLSPPERDFCMAGRTPSLSLACSVIAPKSAAWRGDEIVEMA